MSQTNQQTFDPFMFKLERNHSLALLIDISLIISCLALAMVIGLISFRCIYLRFWINHHYRQENQLEHLNNLIPDSLP